MGLMHFLRRRFAGQEAGPEPPPLRSRPLDRPPPIVEPVLPIRRGVTGAPVARTPPGSQVSHPGGALPRQDILGFAERRDARIAEMARDARQEILRLHEMVDQLHRQRRRLTEDRDRWQRVARELEAELLALRHAQQRGGANPLVTADRFRRAKMVLARLTHPDSSGASGLEASIRAKLFQEFWAEFERIEAE
jgi:hypothetical protein